MKGSRKLAFIGRAGKAGFQSRACRRTLGASIPATALALASVLVAQAGFQPALADSTVGGAISRDEVLSRAQYWVDQSVPYSQSATYPDPQGRAYRTDCSGYVSMAWHLATSATTTTIPSYANQLANFNSLQPGDALNTSGVHVMLFRGWKNSDHSVMHVAEEPETGRVASNMDINTSYFANNGYVPLSYKNITGTVSSAPRVGKVYVNSLSGGAWSGVSLVDGGGSVSQVSAVGLSNGTMHVDTLSAGKVYDNQRNTSGSWTGAALEDGGGSVNQVATAATSGGVMHVLTLTNGKVYERQRNADGSWNSPVLVDGNGSIAEIAASGLTDGTMHLQTLVNGKVYDNAWVNGSWTGASVIDAGGAVGSISSAGTAGSTMHVITVSYGKVYDHQRNADGSWNAISLEDGGGQVSEASVAALPNGVMHVVTLSNGRIYDRQRNADGSWNSVTLVDGGGGVFDIAAAATTDGALRVISLS